MAWTTVNCVECGSEYEVQMYGKQRERDWRVRTWKGVCDDCKENAIITNNEKNKDGKFVQLIGSEKQISWAYEIRERFVRIYESEKEQHQKDIECCDILYDRILEKQYSTFWIDRNNSSVGYYIREEFEIFKKEIEKQEKIIKQEFTLINSENPITSTIAHVRKQDEFLVVVFEEKNEKFRNVIKSKEFKYDSNGKWKRKIGKFNGPFEDRFIEICYKLLKSGFNISVENDDYIEKIQKADFKKEQKYWITTFVKGQYKDHFCVNFFYDDGMYNESKKLTGARYVKPDMSVPYTSWEEVIDFAEINGYSFSEMALELVEKGKSVKENSLCLKLEKEKVEEIEKQIESFEINPLLIDED